MSQTPEMRMNPEKEHLVAALNSHNKRQEKENMTQVSLS